MTFTLGLASVFLFFGSLKSSGEIDIDLPKVQSDSPIIISPGNPPSFYSGHRNPENKDIDKVVKTKKNKRNKK
jgi:hypothetical protein